MNDDKKKALDAAINQIERAYGKGAVMKLGDNAGVNSVETVPTGSLSLDIALGAGGIPRGRVIAAATIISCQPQKWNQVRKSLYSLAFVKRCVE